MKTKMHLLPEIEEIYSLLHHIDKTRHDNRQSNPGEKQQAACAEMGGIKVGRKIISLGLLWLSCNFDPK